MSLVHPATCLVAGGTGSGKTVFTRKLIENHRQTFVGMSDSPRVIWCYGIAVQQKPIANVKIRYHEGMVDESILDRSKPDILVIDDMMNEKSNDVFVHNLFTKISHHSKVTVIFITQNLYEKGQCKMKRSCHYIVMMRNPSDKSQVTTLGRQLYPRKKQLLEHFYESYEDATKKRFGYLFIDVSPQSDDDQKLKTDILPNSKGELRVIIYQPK